MLSRHHLTKFVLYCVKPSFLNEEGEGFQMIIREINVTDAAAFLRLQQQLDEETTFMLFEPGERQIKVEEQEKRIQHILDQKNQRIFVAEEESRLIGFIAGFGSNLLRTQHSAYIVIGVLQTFAGKGVGTQLMTKLEEWALEKGIHRLELTVMVHNERAIALYRKMGFRIEGIKKHSLFVQGKYINEYYMAKLLES